MPDNIPSNIEVEQIRQDWALALMSQGVIVKLSVKRWRAKAKLTPQLLGMSFIDDDSHDFSTKYLSMGQQKLLPPQVLRELNIIETRARTCLRNYSFNTVWGKFVPFTAFENWERENKVIRDDFMLAAKAVGDKYEDIISQVEGDYRNMARDVWARIHPNNKQEPTEAFITDFVMKVVDKIPSRENLIATFNYEPTYFVIPMPSMIQANVARATEIRQETEMKQFDNDLEMRTKQRVADEYMKRKHELIDGFLEATVVEMRRYISDLCESVLMSIGQKSKMKDINKGSIDKLKNMIVKVRLLNFHNDKEMTDRLNDLETEIEKFKGQRDRDVIHKKLEQIVEIGKKEFAIEDFNPTLGYLEL